MNSPAQVKNDLNPEVNAEFHMDALEFLKAQTTAHFDGVLFDPRYSSRQASECYRSFGREPLTALVTNNAYYRQLRGIATTVDSIKVEMDSLREDNVDLKSRIALFEQQPGSDEHVGQNTSVRLRDCDSLEQFLTQNSRDHFELTNKARKAFKTYAYLDEERLNAGLKLLRDVFIPMKLATDDAKRGRLYESFQREMTSLRLTYGKTATDVGRGMAPDDHTVKIGTRTLDLYKLRDLTYDFNWQHFFCVYFAWDDERLKLVINGFGHGDSPSAHT